MTFNDDDVLPVDTYIRQRDTPRERFGENEIDPPDQRHDPDKKRGIRWPSMREMKRNQLQRAKKKG